MSAKLPDWDIESGWCPYNHLLKECHHYSRRRNRCSIKDKEDQLFKESQGICLRTRTGSTKHSGYGASAGQVNKTFCILTLVCGHEVEYLRPGIKWHQHFYCSKCEDWRYAHEVSAISYGEMGMVWWPLEVNENTQQKIWKHEKSAGYARA